MPLVIPGLAIGLIALLTEIVLIGLRRGAFHWVGGLLGGFSEQRGFRRWFFHAIGLTAAVRSITWVIGRVQQSVGIPANKGMPQLTSYLHGVSLSFHYLAQELGAIAPSIAKDFSLFRHRTLPKVIDHRIHPTAQAAAHAGALAGRSISLGQRETRERRRSIDRIATRIGTLAAGFAGIDALVKHRHAHRHHADHTHTLPKAAADARAARGASTRAEREVDRVKARLKRIERALGLGIFAVLIYRILARVAPWLFCRNWKVLGRAVCGLNPLKLQALLGLLTAVIVLRDLKSLTRHAEGIVGAFTHGITKTLTGIDLPGERFTID